MLLGALIADGPVWRSGGALAVLRPWEADMRWPSWFEQMVEVVAGELAGRRSRRRARRLSRPGRQRPFGVLVHAGEPAPAEVADLCGKVVSGGLARLVGELRAWRAAGPRLANTDATRSAWSERWSRSPTRQRRPRGSPAAPTSRRKRMGFPGGGGN